MATSTAKKKSSTAKSAAKKPSSANTNSSASKLETRVKALEARVTELEEHRLHFPKDLSETQSRIVKWAQENTLTALGTAIAIGLILGLILT